MDSLITRGANLRDALRLAVTLGVRVEEVRRTDDYRLWHPSWPRPITASGGRKDSGRIVTARIRQLQKAVGRSCAGGIR